MNLGHIRSPEKVSGYPAARWSHPSGPIQRVRPVHGFATALLALDEVSRVVLARRHATQRSLLALVLRPGHANQVLAVSAAACALAGLLALASRDLRNAR